MHFNYILTNWTNNRIYSPALTVFMNFLKDEFVTVLLGDNVKDKDFDVSNFFVRTAPLL